MTYSGAFWPICIQTATALVGLLALIVMPPLEGAILILPIRATTPGMTFNWAAPSGAALLAIGPTPGSLIVFGRRDILAATAFEHGSLLLAAPSSLCGGTLSVRNGDGTPGT